MVAWPATLPQSLEIPLGRKRQSARLRSDMDTGPAKQRPRFTAAVKTFETKLTLTGAELAIFDAFYEDDLGQGALSFDWKDPVTDVAASLRFVDEPEEQQISADETPADRLYVVTLKLELLP